jgi:hypothetical protein
MKDLLTDLQIAKIEAFCADEEMYEAVRQVILQAIYTHGVPKKGKKHNPLQNGAFSLASLAVNNPIPDEQLGQHIRGMWAGVNALENGFNSLKSIKSEKSDAVESPFNIAE